MNKAVGMVEYKTIASGMTAADTMIKTAEIDIVEASTVCPGKYIVLISGQLSCVKAAVEAAVSKNSAQLIDSFILGNPHPSIFEALYGCAEIKNPDALGIIETFSSSAAIVAADTAAKTALVDLIELRLARGMCGKSYLLITGEVAAVNAAVEKAEKGASDEGMLLDCSVIARPDGKLWKSVL